MKALLGFVLAIVLAVGCGSSEKSVGGPVGGAGGGDQGGAAGQGGKSVQGGVSGGPGVSGTTAHGGAEGGAAAEVGGASEGGGASDFGGANDAGGAGGADSAGAPTVPDPCHGKSCGGHGSCSVGTCSCDAGYDSTTGCTSCSGGYVGYPNCATYPVCNTYENFVNGSVCRACKAEDTTICVSDGAGQDLCFCAKACPGNTCSSLQGVQGQCRSGSIDLCFLSCPVANAGTSMGCPAGFTCRAIAGGDATCIQD